MIGTAKVVSVESPLWFLNASTASFQLKLKDSNGNDIFTTVSPPRTSLHRNEIPQHAIPLPVDSIATINNDVSWYISITNTIPQQSYLLPTLSFSQQGFKHEIPFSLPISRYRKMTLSACHIRVSSFYSEDEVENNGQRNPEQKAVVLRAHNAFR